ncbi:hypothetical protein MKW98_019166 [Papaver atlanticum]|uniref:Uncharacterized protein n=1 Tax=Papaver atlanticum TaxID=357466 RepID=A0AAD4XTT0_9MAGN|nr:hypothetical protein MKW98_019166 [Papaver atlanticum]
MHLPHFPPSGSVYPPPAAATAVVTGIEYSLPQFKVRGNIGNQPTIVAKRSDARRVCITEAIFPIVYHFRYVSYYESSSVSTIFQIYILSVGLCNIKSLNVG